MSALTVRLPDDIHQRLKALARSRGTTLNGLIDEMATMMLAEFDAETRFHLRAARRCWRCWRCWRRLSCSDHRNQTPARVKIDWLDGERAGCELPLRQIVFRHQDHTGRSISDGRPRRRRHWIRVRTRHKTNRRSCFAHRRLPELQCNPPRQSQRNDHQHAHGHGHEPWCNDHRQAEYEHIDNLY
jgi:hypothetical protein